MTRSVTLLSVAVTAGVAITLIVLLLSSGSATAQNDGLSLLTETPDEGYALAVSLARRGVSTTQPDREVLGSLRDDYAMDAGLLIDSSRVIAIHFRTVAEANEYWR